MNEQALTYHQVQDGVDPDGVTPRYVMVPDQLPEHRVGLYLRVARWADPTLQRWVLGIPSYSPTSIIVLSKQWDGLDQPHHYAIHLPKRADHLLLGDVQEDELTRCGNGEPGEVMTIQDGRAKAWAAQIPLRLCAYCFPFGV